MATQIRGAQINENIAGVGLELDGNTLNVLIDGSTLHATASGGSLEVTSINLQSGLSDGETSGSTVSGTTNGSLGQVLYVDSSGDWALAKADSESTMPAAAIAVDGDTALTYGYIHNDAWSWTPGGLIYVSDETAGALTQTILTSDSSQVQVVGVATHANRMFFNPNYILTEIGDAPYYTKEELTTSGVLDVRYYTEDEIDAMIATVSGAAITDHGELDGLDDDDHTHYSLADGTRAFTGTVSGVDPVVDAHLATKGYVDTEIASVSGSLTDDIVWEVVDTPYNQIRPKADHMGLPIYTSGNLTIGGDLTVSGTTTTIHSQELTVADKVITVNYGEVGNGITGDPQAGIEVDRGQDANYLFVFDERSDNFRVGVSGTQSSFNDYPLQPVATREETPTDTRVAWWDAANYTFRTHGDAYITINSGTDTVVVGVDGSDVATFDTDGMSLASGESVNEISSTVASDSTDDQLITAKAVYDYVAAISGSLTLEHNELEGLQGGNGSDEFYHLNLTAYTALSGINSTDVNNWDTAYSWGDHSIENYFVKGTDTLDDVGDGATYERVLGTQLDSGIYIDATTTIKGIASFDSDNFVVTSGVVSVKDAGIREPELDISNAPSDGAFLQYTTASGMVWSDVNVAGVVTNDEIIVENQSANCNGSTTVFTLDDTPVDDSVQVFLNGLLQEKGSGKDYEQSGDTITFSIAPIADDILIIHYIITD